MPQFAYRAKDSRLNAIEGTIEADSEAAALSRLGREGIYPIAISEAGAASAVRPGRPGRVPRQTVAYATRQLSDLLGGGLPLLSALGLLAKQTEHRALRGIIERVADAVRDGQELSAALNAYPQVFPALYVSLVRAGEVGGGLDRALGQLAELWEHEAELRSRLRSASAYPLFVLAMALAMTAFLMAYVVPALSAVFVESDQVLPLPTRIVLGTSTLITSWWWALTAGLAAAGWGLRRWGLSVSGRAALDRAMLRLPGIGALARKVDTARFTRNLGVLVGQGVPLLSALEVAAQHVSNTLLREAILRIQGTVREGSSIAAALTATGQFPLFVANMVAVGEESGTVDAALVKVAAAYERDVDRTMRTLMTILEPVLLVVVGGLVMFIVLAMLLPIFQIGLVVQ